MTDRAAEIRAHELGDEFRARATADERQFLNWIAVASAGGVTLVLHFLADKDTAITLGPMALLPPLIAWLLSILSAGASQYGMLGEQQAAGSMFHAQGRRERQKRKAAAAIDGSAEQAKALQLAAGFHAEADTHHMVSRRWLRIRETALMMAVGLFLAGALWAVAALSWTVLRR